MRIEPGQSFQNILEILIVGGLLISLGPVYFSISKENVVGIKKMSGKDFRCQYFIVSFYNLIQMRVRTIKIEMWGPVFQLWESHNKKARPYISISFSQFRRQLPGGANPICFPGGYGILHFMAQRHILYIGYGCSRFVSFSLLGLKHVGLSLFDFDSWCCFLF